MRGLQQRKILCIIIIVLLSVFGLALAVYIGTDDAFCGCGAEPAACVTVQNNSKLQIQEAFLELVPVIRPLTKKRNNPGYSIGHDDMNTRVIFYGF